MNSAKGSSWASRYLRTGILLPVVWLLVAVLFATQLVVFDSMPVSVALSFAALDWFPWIIIAPIVLWLGRRFQFSLATWGRSLVVHVLGCLLVTLALELQFDLVMRYGLIAPPQAFGQERRWGPGPVAGGLKQASTLPLTSDGSPAAGTDSRSPAAKSAPGEGRGKTWERGPGGHLGAGGPAGGRSFLRTPRARMSMPLYWVLVAVAHALTYHRRSLERERRALQAEASLAEARLAVLQAQLNPHFLFNTLNTLAQFVHEDPKASERMIEGLARLLRASLAASERRLISVGEELALAECYLEIQCNRFPDRLSIVREIDPRALDRELPTLLIQPLLENAVIHGIAPHTRPGVLFLRVWPEGDTGLRIEISDTGSGEGLRRQGEPLKPAREGVGLRNTRQRLTSIYGDAAEFSLTYDPAGGACSRILIRTAAHGVRS